MTEQKWFAQCVFSFQASFSGHKKKGMVLKT